MDTSRHIKEPASPDDDASQPWLGRRAGGAGACALEIERVTKRYPGVTALNDVSIRVETGSAHGVVGENGAGKSTLVDIVAGMLRPTHGVIRLFGTDITSWPTRLRLHSGVAVVSQGLRLAPHLDIAHNLLTLRPDSSSPPPGRRALYAHAEKVLDAYGLCLDVRARPGELRPDQQQLLVVVRALEAAPRLLLLDEPTSNLAADQVQWLFDVLRKRREAGLTVMFVSHRLPELRALTSHVTVLRDGQVSGEAETAAVSDKELVHLMVGRELDTLFPASRSQTRDAGEPVLEVCGLDADDPVESIHDLHLTVRRGEIVGIAGVQGNGQQTLLRAITGLVPLTDGTLRVGGATLRTGSVRRARRAGIVYVPRDRRREGLLGTLSVADNLVIGNESAVTRRGIIQPDKERSFARAAIERLDIRTPDVRQSAGLLSGGNQQKVVLGRTLAKRADVLLLDDPTQGVDVGTRAEIYRLIADTAAQGVAVLLFSTDASELVRLCDRALVLSRGRVAAELEHSELSEERLVTSAVTADVTQAAAPTVPAAAVRPSTGSPPDSQVGQDAAGHKPDTTARPRTRHQWPHRRQRGPSVFPVLGLLVVLAIATQVVNASFLGPANLFTLLQSIAPLLIVSLGQSAVLLVGGIDLSVGPLMSVVTVIASYWVIGSPGTYWWLLAVILLAGCAVGLVNGLVIEFGAVPDLIATLGTYTILEGAALMIRGQPGGVVAKTFTDGLGRGVSFLPDTFIASLVLAACWWWFLFRSRAGVGLRGVGSSQAAAKVTGVAVRRWRLTAYVASGLSAAIAGLFLTSIIGSGDPASGTTYTLASITAAVVGGVSLFGGEGSPVGVLVGALLVGSLGNLLTLQGFSEYWQSIVVGVLTALAVAGYSMPSARLMPGRRDGWRALFFNRKGTW